MSEIDAMLGGHDTGLHVLTPDQLAAIRDCTISLPVQPQDADKVDESYRDHGRGSIDNVFGTDFNQQEERMSP